mmetsp:Transcript_7091/g.29518  ORF Transcript_7091/g.29518 Transcript_7091/m.29518 type:complete len:256 (-) Transcript_7091:309-1076(-)
MPSATLGAQTPASDRAPTPRLDHTASKCVCGCALTLIWPTCRFESCRSRRSRSRSAVATSAAWSSGICLGTMPPGGSCADGAAPSCCLWDCARGEPPRPDASSSSKPSAPNASRNSVIERRPSPSRSTSRTSSWMTWGSRCARPSHSRPPHSSPQVIWPVRLELNARKASTTWRPRATMRRRTRLLVARSASRSNSSPTRNSVWMPDAAKSGSSAIEPPDMTFMRRRHERTSSYHWRRSAFSASWRFARSAASIA